MTSSTLALSTSSTLSSSTTNSFDSSNSSASYASLNVLNNNASSSAFSIPSSSTYSSYSFNSSSLSSLTDSVNNVFSSTSLSFSSSSSNSSFSTSSSLSKNNNKDTSMVSETTSKAFRAAQQIYFPLNLLVSNFGFNNENFSNSMYGEDPSNTSVSSISGSIKSISPFARRHLQNTKAVAVPFPVKIKDIHLLDPSKRPQDKIYKKLKLDGTDVPLRLKLMNAEIKKLELEINS